MAKASPMVRSFNAGEFSQLMEGRTDIDRYPSSMRKLLNTVAAPQGPAIPRSGTEFINTVYNNEKASVLVPFVFSETDLYMIEFADLRVRFFTEVGLLTYAPVAVSAMTTGPFTFTSATLGAAIGDEVAFSNFPAAYSLNGVVGKITNKVGNVYTVDTVFPALATLITFQVARVYHVVSPYTSAQIINVSDTASLDVVYLTHGDVAVYKLQRTDTYNWQFVKVVLVDGPYLPENESPTTLTPFTTGKATPDMTSASTPVGWGVGSGGFTTSHDAYLAFASPYIDAYFESATDQVGLLIIQSPTAFVCDGYTIHAATANADTSYAARDFAPSDFFFDGSNDGVNWTVLDRQNNYVLYDNNKSVFFKVANTTAHLYYRLRIQTTKRNGPLKPHVRRLILRSTASASITIAASGLDNINNGQGFLTSDVGRLLRMKGNDGTWRELKILSRVNSTVITAQLLGEPFLDVQQCSKWRLGVYSDTTGYPNVSVFHDDRLWFGGSRTYPDQVAGSVVGAYEVMSSTTDTGEVLATSGISIRLNARRLSRVKWMSSNKDGLALGTGSKEFLIRSQDSSNRTLNPADGLRASDSGSRGSANCNAVEVDSQVLFASRGGRTLREFAYTYETDGYKSPSMSSLASHLGISPFVKMAYAAEPYSIVWMLRADGTVVGLTYNRDENVVGWHQHDFGGVVESIAVIPATDQLQDVLWMIIRRNINGENKRYIERMTRFWDFDMTLANAHFVDSGLRYVGSPITRVYGLTHLNGMDAYGLADSIPFGPIAVTNGYIDVPQAASNIVVGLGFDSIGVTSRLENGATDGTAQGKTKRTHNLTVNVWQSYGGEVGTFNPLTNEVEWVGLEYPPVDASQLETIALFSGIIGPFTMAPNYEKDGSIYFRRKKEQPLPFNIVSFMPQMVTQDR